MHWIRVDRYYTGDPENPDVVYQPLMCQHCDNAPCETVCPVIATMHSEEGTNDMIYNRCVGTRYCSNNCPYKVRRFNWFSYTEIPAPKHLALNPEVTVRSRGVMEKCTFCIHRIRETKAHFFAEGRTLKDGDIKTACQQACPTHAIVFGDTHDPESEVSKKLKSENRYPLLEELNTRPAVRYLTKIRNAEQLKGAHESFNIKAEEESSTEEGHHS
jgi:molybdopterin-containing oxidoreductase family iron-sulfur binding subunit